MNKFNESDNFHATYTWTDLRENYDKLKLVDESFIQKMGITIPKNVKLGNVFLVTGFTDDHGTIVNNKFTIPRKYLDCFYANV